MSRGISTVSTLLRAVLGTVRDGIVHNRVGDCGFVAVFRGRGGNIEGKRRINGVAADAALAGAGGSVNDADILGIPGGLVGVFVGEAGVVIGITG